MTLGGEIDDSPPQKSEFNWKAATAKSGHLSVDDDDSDDDETDFRHDNNTGGETGVFIGLMKVVGAGILEAIENLFSGGKSWEGQVLLWRCRLSSPFRPRLLAGTEDRNTTTSRSDTTVSQGSFSPGGRRKARRSCSTAMTNEIRRKSLKLRSQKARKDAVVKFNTKPKLAIEYLREHGGVICNSQEFAEWIYEFIESLSKVSRKRVVIFDFVIALTPIRPKFRKKSASS